MPRNLGPTPHHQRRMEQGIISLAIMVSLLLAQTITGNTRVFKLKQLKTGIDALKDMHKSTILHANISHDFVDFLNSLYVGEPVNISCRKVTKKPG